MARRPTNPMPKDVAELLAEHGLVDDYNERPRYQRNDYLGWIGRAKRTETRSKRIEQMLDDCVWAAST